MSADNWLRVLGIIALLGVSAFFSSVESAYFSLNRAILDRMNASNDPRERRVGRLMGDARLLLASILTGNTIANTAAAALAAILAIDLAGVWGINSNLAVVVEVVAVTVVILYFAELIPKLQAMRDPEQWATRTGLLVQVSKWLFYPIARPLAGLTAGLGRMFGMEQHQLMGMTEEEIRALVQIGHEHGALELEERKMIHSIFELGDTIAREVMVPRIDMIAVEKEAGLSELLELISKHGHSRIPVFDGGIDNVIGVVHVKDLLKASNDPEEFDLTKHLRPPRFVPEEKKIDDLLREFQAEKVHMAIVLDEYGGTAGMVTLEDIIEEIVGEIQDEYDREQPLSSRVDERTLLAGGRLSTYDLNELLGFELIEASEGYDTIAGFVYSQLGVVPRRGDHFEFNGFIFTVEELLGKRISRVRIEKGERLFQDV